MDKLSLLSSTIYGILLILGGIMGYVKAKSIWSLITGVVCGILILISTNFGSHNKKMQYFNVVMISLILAIFFYIRFNATHGFMPAGLMLILSTANFAIVGIGWLKNK